MFVAIAFAYPLALGLLCAGGGLLVDRVSGRFMPVALLPTVGAAALIALSQLLTYAPALAPGTPYAMLAFALAGFAVSWRRIATLPRTWRSLAPLALAVPAYLIALAPVLAAGRATLTSYMALTDSAVHMLGADYLIHHGQAFAHLDLGNSYGRYVDAYYNHSYPSGADTLFGGSAILLRLSLFFAYQPFNAFMLALATGPAWLLLRRAGLRGGLAAAAALGVTLPALVYGYELVGAIKEVTTLPLLLALGVLVVLHERWLGVAAEARRAMPRRVIPFALVVAGGVSVIGVAFCAWALAAAAILLVLVARDVRSRALRARAALASAALAAGVVLLCAWPTWHQLPGSLQTAQAIAGTPNPGNLHRPLRAVQALGTWLGGTYVVEPSGVALDVTYAFVALALILLALGAVRLYSRARVLLAWIALMLVVWLCVTEAASTWAAAKTLMLTSSVVLLLVWAGVAATSASRWRAAAPALALIVLGGVLVSDAFQYHASNLAPTARYQELASLNARYGGRGPTLFTDYDEYALYDLRALDVGGPSFIYPPAALDRLVPRNGYPVDLDRVAPAAFSAYPLIVTRRDPAASRPPAAYRLASQGTYYEVWERRRGAPSAIAHVGLAGGRPVSCGSVRQVAQAGLAWAAEHRGGAGAAVRLVGARGPQLVALPLGAVKHTRRWSSGRIGLLMAGAGALSARFTVPYRGVWDLWLEGELMPTVTVAVDGRRRSSIAGQVGGTSLTQQVMTPLALRLAAGRHSLTVTRASAGATPGGGGWADLRAIFLTPAAGGALPVLREASVADWRALCAAPLQWVEALPLS
jgi:hypothetical protein